MKTRHHWQIYIQIVLFYPHFNVLLVYHIFEYNIFCFTIFYLLLYIVIRIIISSGILNREKLFLRIVQAISIQLSNVFSEYKV